MGSNELGHFLKFIKVIDTCWQWQGGQCGSTIAYGTYRRNGRQAPAHRVSYELFRGPIPDGLVIDHLCRNGLCVRLDHLEAVPQRTNVMRGNGLAAINARKIRCIHGHEFDDANTYWTPVGKRRCRACHRAGERRRNRRLSSAQT